MKNPIVKSFSRLLISSGYTDVKISRLRTRTGQVHYGYFSVSALDPKTSASVSATLTLQQMQTAVISGKAVS